MGQDGGVDDAPATSTTGYAEALRAKQQKWWKRLLPVQAPYHWNLRRQELGRTLDVGCGIGRNLAALPEGSVGVDHNADSVAIARATGRTAMTPHDFHLSELAEPGAFDALLVAHVVEHMDVESARGLLREYLPYVRSGGKVFVLCPQERGFASDPTHVQYFDADDLVALARSVDLEPEQPFSFPFPRWAGRAFIYNETCLVARVA
jgi:SAM-dependent methyltransferase